MPLLILMHCPKTILLRDTNIFLQPHHIYVLPQLVAISLIERGDAALV